MGTPVGAVADASVLAQLTRAAEAEWLDAWEAGPTLVEERARPRPGSAAPDVSLVDHQGQRRTLSEFWSGHPALVMFWRHFGCGCGVERAARLNAEWAGYRQAGLNPVIVAQGEPVRAAAYRLEHGLECTILCDPDHLAYQAYGLGHWEVEQVLYDAPTGFWSHERDVGAGFQDDRRSSGRPPVDDPWRATAEFVVAPNGMIRMAYSYQYCEDFPDPRVLTTAALLV
jgi:peroxiredoxin